MGISLSTWYFQCISYCSIINKDGAIVKVGQDTYLLSQVSKLMWANLQLNFLGELKAGQTMVCNNNCLADIFSV